MEEGELAIASKGGLSLGYKLVPWSSWDQWNYVRESILSSSPESVDIALRRVLAWRSRGCLPVAIDVTAAIVEIQQKDPFFREGAMDSAMSSDELLAMLYSMAITRLVNGFIEPSHKKTRRSISELADAIGIPRVLVDIRHESSHRGLPALPLVRLASIKALDWLKSNYWEPQRCAISDVRIEIRTRLQELVYNLREKHTWRMEKGAKRAVFLQRCSKLSVKLTGKLKSSRSSRFEKCVSNTLNIISRLYSAYPSDVVSVLLDFFPCHVSNIPSEMDDDGSHDLVDPGTGSTVGSISVLKKVMTKLSRKRPKLLLGLLRSVLEMIQSMRSLENEKGNNHVEEETEKNQIDHLCSLVSLLLRHLKVLKDSGQVSFVAENQLVSSDRNALPVTSLQSLLRTCLSLSVVVDDKSMPDAAFAIAEMIGGLSLGQQIKKLLPLYSEGQGYVAHPPLPYHETTIFRERQSIRNAEQQLEILKLRLRNHGGRRRKRAEDDGRTGTGDVPWAIAKSWFPCPIGMLPCSFGCSAAVPFLGEVCSEPADTAGSTKKRKQDPEVEAPKPAGWTPPAPPEADIPEPSPGATSPAPEPSLLNPADTASPVRGKLLIDSFWKKVSEEELNAIRSEVRIMV